jgi:galactokinase
LIGEHTDYNDGFVMPVAIDLSTWADISPRSDRKLVLHSEHYSETVEFELDAISRPAQAHWSNYVLGVVAMLGQMGYRLRGSNMTLHTDIPIGAGLSSSAALEVAAGYAMLDLAEIPIDRSRLALACQRAEHEFAGVRCGIMDQMIACHGRSGHALMLDTRSLSFELLPLPKEVSVIICNTLVKHNLATGAYNTRRAECEAGARALDRSLRDATLSDIDAANLPDNIYRRCRHVITENDRVQTAARALLEGSLREFGRLMDESHRSLRDDYEVSCPELDTMVTLASALDGVYGARMTGGGFGGCTVNLVRAEQSADFQKQIAALYETATGLRPEIYICSSADGVQECK